MGWKVMNDEGSVSVMVSVAVNSVVPEGTPLFARMSGKELLITVDGYDRVWAEEIVSHLEKLEAKQKARRP